MNIERNISRHPNIPEVERTVVVTAIEDYPNDKALILRMNLQHRLNGHPWTQYGVQDRTVSVYTSNEKKVRTAPEHYGSIATPDDAGQYPADAVGEYDFVYWFRKQHPDGSAFSLGELRTDVVRFVIHRMDTGGDFNDLSTLQ